MRITYAITAGPGLGYLYPHGFYAARERPKRTLHMVTKFPFNLDFTMRTVPF